ETFSGTGDTIGFDRLLMPTFYLGRMPNKKVGVTVELWGGYYSTLIALQPDWVKVKTETFSIEPVISGDVDDGDGDSDGGDGDGGGGDGGGGSGGIIPATDTTPDDEDEILTYVKYGAIALGGLAVIAMMIPLIGRRRDG
ncbi:MAG: hypothetical protein WC455_24685, partial [Dehalococcoidia bacterium]